MAKQELASATSDTNEGEGNKMAALAFDGSQAAFAKEADVEGLAIAARDALDGAEGAQLRKAEEGQRRVTMGKIGN